MEEWDARLSTLLTEIDTMQRSALPALRAREAELAACVAASKRAQQAVQHRARRLREQQKLLTRRYTRVVHGGWALLAQLRYGKALLAGPNDLRQLKVILRRQATRKRVRAWRAKQAAQAVEVTGG